MGRIVSVREVDMVGLAVVGVEFPGAGDSEWPSVKHKILMAIIFYFIEYHKSQRGKKMLTLG